jgi:CRISPR-associated protein Cst2
MTWHLFGVVLTNQNTAANNRGENRENTTTLQKILRNGEQYTTVSAEAIRYALREGWQMVDGISLNRTLPDHRSNKWEDRGFENWARYVDDDVLGFMHAGDAKSRRGVLEISRAISTKPWAGEFVRNFASPGSNPTVSSEDPIPYGAEVHHTRYQYGFAMTPQFLGRDGNSTNGSLTSKKKFQRIQWVLEGLQNLHRVGGNHTRYLFDFSPDAIVLRLTTDPAPRFLNCFDEGEHGEISLKELLVRVKQDGDIEGSELIIGSNIDIPEIASLKQRGAWVSPEGSDESNAGGTKAPLKMAGVKAAIRECCRSLQEKIHGTEEA